MTSQTPCTMSASPAPSSTGKRQPRITRKKFNPPEGWVETPGYDVNTVHTAKCDDCNKHGTDGNPLKKCTDCMHKVCWKCEQTKPNGLGHGCMMEGSFPAPGRLRADPSSKSIFQSRPITRQASASSSKSKNPLDVDISPESNPHLYPDGGSRTGSGKGKTFISPPLAKRLSQDGAEETPSKKPRITPKFITPIGKPRSAILPISRASKPFTDGTYDRLSLEPTNRRKPILPILDASTIRTRDEYWNLFSNCSQEEIAEIKRQLMWLFELQPRRGPNELNHNPEAEGRVKRAYYSQIFMNAGFAMTSTGQSEFKALQVVQNRVEQRLQALADSFMHTEESPPTSTMSIDSTEGPGHAYSRSSYGPYNETRETSPVRAPVTKVSTRYSVHVSPADSSTSLQNNAANPYGLGSAARKSSACGQANNATSRTSSGSDSSHSMSIHHMLNDDQETRSRNCPTESLHGGGHNYSGH